MKTAILLGLVAALCPALAGAGPSLLIFGASHHDCDRSKYKCNLSGDNPGLGLEWAFDQPTFAGGQWLVRGGAYRDSFRDTASFVATGWRREWEVGNGFKLGVVGLAGYLDGSSITGFAAMPLLSIGWKSLMLEVGYIPKGHVGPYDGNVAVTTFNLRWEF